LTSHSLELSSSIGGGGSTTLLGISLELMGCNSASRLGITRYQSLLIFITLLFYGARSKSSLELPSSSILLSTAPFTASSASLQGLKTQPSTGGRQDGHVTEQGTDQIRWHGTPPFLQSERVPRTGGQASLRGMWS